MFRADAVAALSLPHRHRAARDSTFPDFAARMRLFPALAVMLQCDKAPPVEEAAQGSVAILGSMPCKESRHRKGGERHRH
jgi:hypothetical protein